MTSRERLERLAAPSRPAPRKGSWLDIGDADLCPVNASHGRMYTLRRSGRQYCPHQGHDADGTPCRWPYLPERDFVAAVEAWRASQPLAVPA